MTKILNFYFTFLLASQILLVFFIDSILLYVLFLFTSFLLNGIFLVKLKKLKEGLKLGGAAILNIWFGQWWFFELSKLGPADPESQMLENLMGNFIYFLFFLTLVINLIGLIRAADKESKQKKTIRR